VLNAEKYMKTLIEELKETFGSRLAYVGLQGSYLRNEATEESDIDPMVVIDGLSAEDLKAYRSIVERMESPEKSCGFLCGKAQLKNWNRLEIRHLLGSTKDLYGRLSELVPACTQADMRSYILFSLNNLSHAMCHRRIHSSEERNSAHMAVDYKAAFFILQDLHAYRTGCFIQKASNLAKALEGVERAILEKWLEMKAGAECSLDADFERLFSWVSETMAVL